MHVSKAVLLVSLIGVAGGCGSSPTAPPAPQPTPTPAQPVLATFADPSSSFSTKDVHDVKDHIVNFDTSTNSLIWSLTGQKFTGYPVSGNLIGGTFQARFGTKDGDCRAYFTEAATGTICDIEVSGGGIAISPTPTTPGGPCK
jgi:hypothetical protein